MPNSSVIFDEYGRSRHNGWLVAGLYELHIIIYKSIKSDLEEFDNNMSELSRHLKWSSSTFKRYFYKGSELEKYSCDEVVRIYHESPKREIVLDITQGLLFWLGSNGVIKRNGVPMSYADMLSLLLGIEQKFTVPGDYGTSPVTLVQDPVQLSIEQPYEEAIALMRAAVEDSDLTTDELLDLLPELDDWLSGKRIDDHRDITKLGAVLGLQAYKSLFYRVYGYSEALDPAKSPDSNKRNQGVGNGAGNGKVKDR